MSSHPPRIREILAELDLLEKERKSLPEETRKFISQTKRKTDVEFADFSHDQIQRFAVEFLQAGAGMKYWKYQNNRRWVWPRDKHMLIFRVNQIISRQKIHKGEQLRKNMTKALGAQGQPKAPFEDDFEAESVDSTASDVTYIPEFANHPYADLRQARLNLGFQEPGHGHDIARHIIPIPQRQSYGSEVVPASVISDVGIEQESRNEHDFYEEGEPMIFASGTVPLQLTYKPGNHRFQVNRDPSGLKRNHESMYDEELETIKLSSKRPQLTPTVTSKHPTPRGPSPEPTPTDMKTSTRRSHHDLVELNGRLYAPLQLIDVATNLMKCVSGHQNKHVRLSCSPGLSNEKKRENTTYAEFLKKLASDMDVVTRSFAFDAADDEKVLAESVLDALRSGH